MKAVILAGGRGSRLGKLTESKPKPLIDILGKPILEHLIINASAAGIKNYLINICYRGDMIQDYFNDGKRFGVEIAYLGSVGKGPEDPIFRARDYLDGDTFCCFCADNILLPWQIKKMLKLHEEKKADATFTLEENDPSTTKRVKVFDSRLTGSSQDIEDPVLVYNFIMQRTFVDALYEATKDKEERAFAFVMDDLAKQYNVRVADIGSFININMPEDIQKAEAVLRRVRNGRD